MITHETKIRVRYSETDKMGYVYYGHYAQYYEVSRTELLRSLGFNYKQFEDAGFMMPVFEFNIKYYKPAFYDDELTIKTMVKSKPLIKINFEYEVYSQNNELLNTGSTLLVFVDFKTRKPIKAPLEFLKKIDEIFKNH